MAEEYGYLHSDRELEAIARAAGALNGRAERVHLAINNNRRDYPAINGLRLKEMLLEGERKHLTVLFADIKDSMELLADRDPEQALLISIRFWRR